MARLNKKNFRHKKVFLTLLIILILILGYWVYGQITTFSNKRDFQQTSNTIDNVQQHIYASLGKPEKKERENKCSKSYQEISGYGEITCFVDLSFVYTLDNEAEANILIKKIQHELKGYKVFSKPKRNLAPSLTDAIALGVIYHEAQDLYSYKNLNCTAKYVFDTPQDTFLKIIGAKKVFYVVIGCSGPAKKQYYPLNQ